MLAAQSWQSAIVNYTSNGKLNYVADVSKNRIPNFSFAGYKRGEAAIPAVSVKKTISPVTGDNTANIQAAIDYVGALTPDAGGIRGAVLLNAGIYNIYGTIYINYDGVVLRGVGDGSDPLTNTILYGVGDGGVVNGDTILSQRSLVVAGGGSTNRWASKSGSTYNITNDTLFVGDTVIALSSTSSFAVGDNIIIYSPSTTAWLEAVNYGGTHSTDPAAEPGVDVPWTVSSELDIVYNRYIKAINGSSITLDVPIYYKLKRALSQAYVYKYSRYNLKKYIGVENLRIDNDYASATDENHVWQSLDLFQIEDSWVQNCTFIHFGLAGVRTATASRITIQNCNSIDPISIITGERRYNFDFYQGSQQILIRNCYAQNGRHHYISNGTASTSGNVILNCTSSGMYQTSEGHRRWTQAILYDNLKELDGPRSDGNDVLLGLYCRGYFGTSHGWAMVNGVAWNCNAAQGNIVIQQAPTGQNFAIGCKAKNVTGLTPIAPVSEPQGYIEGTNQTGLVPQSLYTAQFQERMGSYIAPTTQASNVLFSAISTTSATISCTAGNGALRIFVVRSGGAVTANPGNNATYTANAVFGLGSQVGAGNYAVYKGTGTSVTITGLSTSTTYYVNIYELNGSSGNESYLTANPATGSVTTLTIEPIVQASNIQFSAITASSVTVSCTAGNGTQRIFVIHSGSGVTSDPVDNMTYTPNSNFGSGSQIGNGNYVAYVGTGTTVAISGLASGTVYYVNVYEFNGGSGSENYLSSSPGVGFVTTLATEPTTQAANLQFSGISATSFTVSCTPGTGAQRIMIMHADSAVSSDPADNVTYSSNGVYGVGSQIGAGNYVVYKGTGTTATISGLSALTAYYLNVYEFNGSGGLENYLTINPAGGSVTTSAPEPTLQASDLQFSSVTVSSVTLSCKKGNGSQRLVVVRAGASVTSDPLDNTSYSANNDYGVGSQAGSGNYVVYRDTGSSVTITGLSAGTAYYFNVYEVNGAGGNENYLITNPATGSVTTNIVGIYSTATGGAWTSGATWVGGVAPGAGDNAIIVSSAMVTLASAVTVLSTTVNSGGRLSLTANSTLNGNIYCAGTLTGSSYTLTTNSNVTISGSGALLSFSSSSGKLIAGAAKTFTLANGATFELSATGASPLATVVSGTWTWVVDNSRANTTISYKNSGSTTIAVLPNSQTYGNLVIKSPTGSGSNSWTNTLGASLNILGNLTVTNVAPDATVRTQTFNMGGNTITGNGINSAVFITNSSVGGTIALLSATATPLTNFAAGFPGFVSCSYINSSTASLSVPGGTYAAIAMAGTGSMSINANMLISDMLSVSCSPSQLSSGAFAISYGASSSLVYNGSMAQTTSNTEFPAANGPTNVTCNNSAGITFHAARIIPGIMTLGGNGIYNNISNISGYSGITYSASVQQSTGSEIGPSLELLTINNSNGVKLSSSTMVAGTLTLSSGKLLLGNSTLTLGTACSLTGTFSDNAMIAADGSGKLVKLISDTQTVPYVITFPVGDNTGTAEYSPVTIAINSGSFSSAQLGITLSNAKHAANSSVTDFINRFWNITGSGITNPIYSIVLGYTQADIAGTEANLVGGKYTSSSWAITGAVNLATHTITGSNLTSFGEFSAGETVAFSSVGSGAIQITAIQEGYYHGSGALAKSDTLQAYLATAPEFSLADSCALVIDSVTFTGTATFKHAANGSYYLVLKGRAIIQTWSSAAISFTRGNVTSYDFTTNANQAYGSNMVQKGSKWCLYSGDVDQSGFIDNNDLLLIDNDAYNFKSGYLITDLDGSTFIDNNDLLICDNNAYAYVGMKTPQESKLLSKMRKNAVPRSSTMEKP